MSCHCVRDTTAVYFTIFVIYLTDIVHSLMKELTDPGILLPGGRGAYASAAMRYTARLTSLV